MVRVLAPDMHMSSLPETGGAKQNDIYTCVALAYCVTGETPRDV